MKKTALISLLLAFANTVFAQGYDSLHVENGVVTHVTKNCPRPRAKGGKSATPRLDSLEKWVRELQEGAVVQKNTNMAQTKFNQGVIDEMGILRDTQADQQKQLDELRNRPPITAAPATCSTASPAPVIPQAYVPTPQQQIPWQDYNQQGYSSYRLTYEGQFCGYSPSYGWQQLGSLSNYAGAQYSWQSDGSYACHHRKEHGAGWDYGNNFSQSTIVNNNNNYNTDNSSHNYYNLHQPVPVNNPAPPIVDGGNHIRGQFNNVAATTTGNDGNSIRPPFNNSVTDGGSHNHGGARTASNSGGGTGGGYNSRSAGQQQPQYQRVAQQQRPMYQNNQVSRGFQPTSRGFSGGGQRSFGAGGGRSFSGGNQRSFSGGGNRGGGGGGRGRH